MFSNIVKKCFKLWCVLCAVQFVTIHTHTHTQLHFGEAIALHGSDQNRAAHNNRRAVQIA